MQRLKEWRLRDNAPFTVTRFWLYGLKGATDMDVSQYNDTIWREEQVAFADNEIPPVSACKMNSIRSDPEVNPAFFLYVSAISFYLAV